MRSTDALCTTQGNISVTRVVKESALNLMYLASGFDSYNWNYKKTLPMCPLGVYKFSSGVGLDQVKWCTERLMLYKLYLHVIFLNKCRCRMLTRLDAGLKGMAIHITDCLLWVHATFFHSLSMDMTMEELIEQIFFHQFFHSHVHSCQTCNHKIINFESNMWWAKWWSDLLGACPIH